MLFCFLFSHKIFTVRCKEVCVGGHRYVKVVNEQLSPKLLVVRPLIDFLPSAGKELDKL